MWWGGERRRKRKMWKSPFPIWPFLSVDCGDFLIRSIPSTRDGWYQKSQGDEPPPIPSTHWLCHHGDWRETGFPTVLMSWDWDWPPKRVRGLSTQKGQAMGTPLQVFWVNIGHIWRMFGKHQAKVGWTLGEPGKGIFPFMVGEHTPGGCSILVHYCIRIHIGPFMTKGTHSQASIPSFWPLRPGHLFLQLWAMLLVGAVTYLTHRNTTQPDSWRKRWPGLSSQNDGMDVCEWVPLVIKGPWEKSNWTVQPTFD